MPLDEFPIVATIPIQWGDQDALGHVNNVVLFRWFESARIKYLENLAIRSPDEPSSLATILAAVNCNFRQQLRYPDTVHVGVRVVKVGRTSITLEHQVFSESHQYIAADGQSTVVLFDYATQESTPIPDRVRKRVAQIENS